MGRTEAHILYTQQSPKTIKYVNKVFTNFLPIMSDVYNESTPEQLECVRVLDRVGIEEG